MPRDSENLTQVRHNVYCDTGLAEVEVIICSFITVAYESMNVIDPSINVFRSRI